ncbi:unnamed protein product [Rotaria socialis]|uniref:HAT C-terminal dimerisation domain-containing protein n=1 Tax=Rotaria socialis TaxID=392032 RepID=A0A817XI80_9BILA|nr:unnamed protein product [Rotaria socialis]
MKIQSCLRCRITVPVELGFQSTNSKSLLSQCLDVSKNDLKSSIIPYGELEEYMALNLKLNENDDVLLFWLQHKLKFPTLLTMVQDFYAMPASNAIIERLFSSSKNTVTDKRSSLGAEKPGFVALTVLDLKMVVLNSECNSTSNDAKFLWGHRPKFFDLRVGRIEARSDDLGKARNVLADGPIKI